MANLTRVVNFTYCGEFHMSDHIQVMLKPTDGIFKLKSNHNISFGVIENCVHLNFQSHQFCSFK